MNDSTSATTDPICGMTVDPKTALHTGRDGEDFYFCSDHCQKEFLTTPSGPKPERTPGGLL